MNTENNPSHKPCVIVARGVLSGGAMKQLREAGFVIVQATDPTAVKQFYPDTANSASNRAKVAAFEYAIDKPDAELTRSNLRAWYIHFLKQEKAF